MSTENSSSGKDKSVVLSVVDTGFGERKLQITTNSGGYVQGNGNPGGSTGIPDPVYYIFLTKAQAVSLMKQISTYILGDPA